MRPGYSPDDGSIRHEEQIPGVQHKPKGSSELGSPSPRSMHAAVGCHNPKRPILARPHDSSIALIGDVECPGCGKLWQARASRLPRSGRPSRKRLKRQAHRSMKVRRPLAASSKGRESSPIQLLDAVVARVGNEELIAGVIPSQAARRSEEPAPRSGRPACASGCGSGHNRLGAIPWVCIAAAAPDSIVGRSQLELSYAVLARVSDIYKPMWVCGDRHRRLQLQARARQ